MECGIIIFHCVEQLSHLDLCVQFFPYLPDQRFLRRLSRFYLTAWKFPSVLKLAVSPLGGKNLVVVGDDGGSYFGEFVTKDGGYILKEDLDFSKLPTGSYIAEEITPPEGYILSSDVSKVLFF